MSNGLERVISKTLVRTVIARPRDATRVPLRGRSRNSLQVVSLAAGGAAVAVIRPICPPASGGHRVKRLGDGSRHRKWVKTVDNPRLAAIADFLIKQRI